ncbi:DUF2007 domain-containing protein [Vibrio artabrorum]|uniref:DUF2007 domain-containing protein n=1 Tax=Vibrio artabrorum TaxID=446374 RepID=A0ABT8CJE5_9VIBR|nr:DUF2007 domain-containing protein [Vibrio artabrorum]MDN3701445.1 DUF2007 domain-containing protein [Vibrio artabrorum]
MKIFSASNPTEAHIICGLLESENIACEVRGEGLFGLKGEIPFTEDTDPYVWLCEPEMTDKARLIVSEYQKQQDSIIYEEWRCRKCHEINEAQFGSCWQCGTASPE